MRPQCWVGMFVVLAVGSCGGNWSRAGAGRCKEPAVSAKSPRRSIPAGPATVDSGNDSQGALLQDGRYWVRRPAPRSGVSRSVSGLGNASVPHQFETRGSTQCVRLDVDDVGGARALRFAGFELRIVEDDESWTLLNPTLVERQPLVAFQTCGSWTLSPSDEDARHVLTTAGPMFSDRETCKAVPSTYVKRCVGEECTYRDPLAQPFELAECDAVLGRLDRAAALIADSSHAATMQTLQRFSRMTTTGGRLWEYQRDGKRCHRVALRPLRGQRVEVRVRYKTEDGATVDDVATYESIEPLFHRFSAGTRMVVTRTLDGHGGGITSAGRSHYGGALHVGDGVVVLGARWLFMQRDACEANPTVEGIAALASP